MAFWQSFYQDAWQGFWQGFWIAKAVMSYALYSDGTKVTVDTLAPLNFDSTTPVDLLKNENISYDPAVDDNFNIKIKALNVSNNDRFFAFYDSANPETRFLRGMYRASGNRWRIQAGSALTGTKTSDFTGSFVAGENKVYGFRIDSANNKIYATIDGIDTTDDETIDFTGTTFDVLTIGTSIGETTHPDFLLHNCDSDQLGFWNFLSNTDKGATFLSDKYRYLAATDSSPTTLQYPNYTPSDSDDLVESPKTGRTRLRNDIIKATGLTSTNLADGKTRYFKGLVNLDSSAGGFDAVFDIGNSGIGATSLRLLFNSGNLQVFWDDDANNSKAVTPVLSVSTGVDLFYTVEVSSSLLKLTVNGTSQEDSTILGGACTVDEIFLGARGPASFNIPCDYSWFMYSDFDTDELAFVNMDVRLWTQSDPNGNKFIATNGVEFVLTDALPTGAVFPYIGVWPTVYLVEDIIV